MTREQADQVHVGSEVTYRGVRCKVMSVKLGDIAGPHFRLFPLEQAPPEIEVDCGRLTSYRLVSA